MNLGSSDEARRLDVHSFADALGAAPTARKSAVVCAEQMSSTGVVRTVLADGLVETSNVYGPGDWVVTNPGGEQYVMSGERFADRYSPTALAGRFAARGRVRAIQHTGWYDIEIVAPWGEKMRGAPGCFVVEVVPDVTNLRVRSTDRYLIGEHEFRETYDWVLPGDTGLRC